MNATPPRIRLGSKALPELEQAVSPSRRFEHVAVDDHARLAAMLDVKNCANIGGPVAGEALVCPAKGMWSEDHIVELENGIVGVRRFLFEHVEPRAADPSLLKRLGKRVLVNDRPAGRVDEIGCRLH